MVHTQAHLQSNWSTELNDRTLWFDGQSVVDEKNIEHFLQKYPNVQLFVDYLTNDIQQYNKLVTHSKQIVEKHTLNAIKLDWKIPEEYKNFNLKTYLAEKLVSEAENTTNLLDYAERVERVIKEFSLYKKLNLLDALKALIYIINTLSEHQIVWGIGRGSCVSSYILYLIGVHDVDSVEYELDIEDFLHE